MRTDEYSDDKVKTKNRWDKLFWIELAKRKERLVTGDAHRMLVELHDQIAQAIDTPGRMMDEPVEGVRGAAILLDAFQWQYDPADKADDEHQAQLLRDTMNRFESQIDEVWSRLQFTQGFRLADLAVENDLEDMWQWWVFVNSSAGRAELGITSGKFSHHGIQSRMDEDHEPPRMIEVHTFYNRPGQSPIPISNRSVRSFTTDVDEVTINGKRVTDSVVVVFDSETPAPSRREIMNAAYSGRGMIRARRLAQAMEKGDYARLQRLLDEPSPATDFVDLFEPVQAHKLFKTLTSVAPLIRGLFAWDLHYDQGLSKAQACRVTAEKLPGMGTTPRSVNNALISVGEKINGYQPEQLPWIFQRFGD